MTAPWMPPLPEPDVRDYGRAHDGFTQDKMRAYGLACYQQAIEDAAKFCDENAVTIGHEGGDAIRRLKDTP